MNRQINEALTKSGRRRLIVAATVAVSALTLAGCSGSSASTSSSSLPTSMSALVKEAQKEGQVVWSAPKTQNQMQGAIDLFEKKYPGITVKYTDTNAPDQISQIKVQEAARKVAIDVTAAGELTVPPALNYAQAIDWTKYGVDKSDSDFGNKLVYIWASPKVWAYNTKDISTANAPKTWPDLLKTGVSGSKIAIEGRGSFMTVWNVDSSLGKDQGLAWAKKLAALKPHYTPNTTQDEQLIESGQAAIGTSLMNLALLGQKSGAPVAIAPVTPTSTNETFLYVPKGAPDPAAAVLLSSFLSSTAAQNALAKSYNSRIPEHTDCSNPDQNAVVKELCTNGIKWYSTGGLSGYNQLSGFFTSAQKTLGTYVG